MFHKINSEDLCAGMYIIDTGVSWLEHPYLYSTEGELTPQELETLKGQGYTEAYIDLTRCRPGTLPPALEVLVPSVMGDSDPAQLNPPPPKMDMAEELPNARKIFRSTLNTAKSMMDNIRQGINFDMKSAEPMVEEILSSLDRNSDALFSLVKLRQTDDYTYTHCVNSSVLVSMFARGLGITGNTLYGIGLGGLFHDVGKALVPSRILHAPRRLSDQEMAIMKRHPILGYEYLVDDYHSAPAEILQTVLEHHEQYTGNGYPHQLSGDEISLAGRLSAVVDVFDALSSRRVYKEAMPLSKALSILYSMREKEFFPGMVERFIRLLGVYPIGSAVELEDGTKAVVSVTSIGSPMRPTVVLVCDKDGKDLARREYNLDSQGAPGISRSLTASELGLDPGSVIGLPVN